MLDIVRGFVRQQGLDRELIELGRAAALSILRQEYDSLQTRQRENRPLSPVGFGYSCLSQGDEDGIIDEIFNRIGVTTRTFVEFGIGNGLENNTHLLLLRGWSGLWLEADGKSVSSAKTKFSDLIDSKALRILQARVSPSNIDEILVAYCLPSEFDLLSVDIDGNDYHVLRALGSFRPRVIVVEYNATKGPSVDWVMTYNPDHQWDGTDYYGASLKAYERLMATRGYQLVGCSITGVNAFFVRSDLCTPSLFHTPATAEEHFEPQRKLLRLGIRTGHRRSYGRYTTSASKTNM